MQQTLEFIGGIVAATGLILLGLAVLLGRDDPEKKAKPRRNTLANWK